MNEGVLIMISLTGIPLNESNGDDMYIVPICECKNTKGKVIKENEIVIFCGRCKGVRKLLSAKDSWKMCGIRI